MNPKAVKAIIVALFVLVCLPAAYSYTATLRGIKTTGTVVIEGLEIYWDTELTQNVTEVDWGRLRPGENVTVVFYVVNVGNEPGNITLWTSNWSDPKADMYLSLTWNHTGREILVQEVLPVALMLSVDPDIADVHDFSFDIGISISSRR